jgi:hypothetical protein
VSHGLTTSDWLALAGLVVALVGFGVTIIQVVRVRSAVTDQIARSARQMLMITVTQMERTERDLRRASNDGLHELATRLVLDWRGQAANVRALLPRARRTPEQEALAAPLELSLAMVGPVLENLDGAKPQLPALLGPLLQQIGSATAAGQSLAVGIMLTNDD